MKNNKNFNPLVSIVIPVYNGENYLKEAIDSALSQTYKNIEILVIDDGSKDDTEKIALSYGNKIRYYKKENGGAATALNYGISKMKGEYFSWLSHDDLYFDYKLEKQIKFISKRKDKDFVLFSNYILIDEIGNQIGKPVRFNSKMLSKKPEYCLLRGCVNGITVLIPKKILIDSGIFDHKLRCTQDYDMWNRMLKRHKFIHSNHIVSKTRIHGAQDSNTSPVADSEGDELWTKLINQISDSRKSELEGNLYNFYYRMGSHILYSPYKNTLKMCIEKCVELNKKKYEKYPLVKKDNKKRNVVGKLFYYIKKQGLSNTFKIIVEKVIK